MQGSGSLAYSNYTGFISVEIRRPRSEPSASYTGKGRGLGLRALSSFLVAIAVIGA
jgi:hypothetical protein